MFEIYTNATRLLETYYIKGDAKTVTRQKAAIAGAIKTAYANANSGKFSLQKCIIQIFFVCVWGGGGGVGEEGAFTMKKFS